MNDPTENAVYLGDAVYVKMEAAALKLITWNGIQITNTIYLEPEVMDELIRFYRQGQL